MMKKCNGKDEKNKTVVKCNRSQFTTVNRLIDKI